MRNLKRWQHLNSKIIVNHPWCKIRQDKIKLPNEQVIDDFFVHIKPDIAYVLPVTDNQEIVFVRQYRYAIDDFFVELPAGSFDPEKEDPKTAALRELEEETGYVAPHLQKIATLYDRPSKDTNKTHLFLAEKVTKSGKQKFDITEDIEVLLIHKDAILEKIYSGEISVNGTVSALLIGLNLLK
ncbi:MAG: NUDIX hydrolase [Cyanobacteria bacterium P01_A01_bin.84]